MRWMGAGLLESIPVFSMRPQAIQVAANSCVVDWPDTDLLFRLIEQIIHGVIGIEFPARFACGEREALGLSRLSARPFDRADNPIARSACKRCEFPAGAIQREAVLIFTTRGVRPQRRDANSVLHFRRLRIPGLRRAVEFRRNPPFDVPAIRGNVLWNAAKFDRLANHASIGITVGPAPTNPSKSRSAPHHTEIWFAESVRAASARDALLYGGGGLVYFT